MFFSFVFRFLPVYNFSYKDKVIVVVICGMFRHMDYVYEVYREGSFSKAAAKLYISQPALSATVKKVEKEIGMPLFDRGHSPVRLTECGKKYISMAEKMRAMEEEFSGYVSSLGELSTGKLTVGGTYLFCAFVLPGILQAFQEMYPNVELSLVEGHTAQLEEKLFEGELDLLMDNYPMDSLLYAREYVRTERLLLAVPAKFPVNAKARSFCLSAGDIRGDVHMAPETPAAPLELFADEPFVLLRAHNDMRERVEAICQRAGITPRVAWKVNQMLTTYHLTERGMGISFISDTVLKYVPTGTDICYYKIDDPDAERNVYFYYRRNRYFTKCMARFMQLAAVQMKQD